MYFTAIFLASLLVSANALTTPHAGQGMLRRHQHAALAKVRAASPEQVSQPLESSATTPKRRLRKRCRPRKTSIAPSASSAASSSAAAATSAANPVNVAPPPIPSSSQPPPPSRIPSSSQAPPPSPSPSPPSPSPSFSPSPSASQAPAPASSSDGGGQSSSLFTGTQEDADGTFYEAGLGACGITNNDSDFIAAISVDIFDHFPGYDKINPNTNPVCNRKILAEYQGKQVTVAVTDRCTGCQPKDLDFTPTAFTQLADLSIGRIHNVRWRWL